LSVLAQKSRTSHSLNHDEVSPNFERKDLMGILDVDVLMATSVFVSVLEMWSASSVREIIDVQSSIEETYRQLCEFEEVGEKFFGFRVWSEDLSPSDQWLTTYYMTHEAGFGVPESHYLQNNIDPDDPDVAWEFDWHSPATVRNEFGLFVCALEFQRRSAKQSDWESYCSHLPVPYLKHAIELSVFAVSQSVINDARPAKISIGCIAPGRIDQRVDVSAKYYRGVLSLEISFDGETLEIDENNLWSVSTLPNLQHSGFETQTITTSFVEPIGDLTPGADALFSDVSNAVEILKSNIQLSRADWATREVHSMFLHQEQGGFVWPVLKLYGREFERGVNQLKPVDTENGV
jgi:hypothetical protein